jgi:hypothetical protein
MTMVEFRRVLGSTQDSDVFLCRVKLRTVPDKGELINIEGEPYVVWDRSWALEDVVPAPRVYCYIRLIPQRCER